MACLRNFSLKKLQQTKEEGETLLAGTAVFFSGVLQQQPGEWQQPLLQNLPDSTRLVALNQNSARNRLAVWGGGQAQTTADTGKLRCSFGDQGTRSSPAQHRPQ